MSTISTQLRHFKEPTKDELTEIFFSVPPAALNAPRSGSATPSETLPGEEQLEKMEINAVLSMGVQGQEDSYVSHLPALAFAVQGLTSRKGRKAVPAPAVSRVRVARPQKRALHDPAVDDPARGAVKCTRGDIRAQFGAVA